MKLMEYIQYLDRQCGDEESYMVTLKPKIWGLYRDKILSRLERRIDIANTFSKGYYRGVEISVFPNGRLILKGVSNEDVLISILNDLLDISS